MRPPRRTAIHPHRRAERRHRRAARTVASHRQPADPASRRNLFRARRDHAAALRPERASPRPRRRARDAPSRRRVPAHRNGRALNARCGRGKHPAATRTASTGRLAPRFSTTISNNARHPLPRQQFPAGGVVTFRGRHRRTVFGTVTELRRHEAIVAGRETGRRRVRYAGLRPIDAGPASGATMQAGRGTTLRNRSNATSTSTPATPLRSRHEPRRPLPARRPDHRAPGRPRTASALEAISRDTLPHEVAHAIAGPGHRRDAVRQTAARRIGCTAKRSSTVARSLKPRMGECSRCRNRWFRQRLTARVRQRSIRPRRRSRIACRINAREPACRDFSPYNPMIDPMAAGPVERPSADLRRPRGRAAFSAHPPTPVDDTPRGSLEHPAGEHARPRTPQVPVNQESMSLGQLAGFRVAAGCSAQPAWPEGSIPCPFTARGPSTVACGGDPRLSSRRGTRQPTHRNRPGGNGPRSGTRAKPPGGDRTRPSQGLGGLSRLASQPAGRLRVGIRVSSSTAPASRYPPAFPEPGA